MESSPLAIAQPAGINRLNYRMTSCTLCKIAISICQVHNLQSPTCTVQLGVDGDIMSLMKQVYLDNNATTPMDPEVFETMRSYYVEDFGNASSIHLQGQRARSAVEDARAQVAELIGAKTKEIVFTSGGTESDNTAVRGVAAQHLSQGDHIITSTIEHSAVLRSCEHLEKKGLKVTYVPVDRHGILRLDRFEEALTEQTVLVSIIHGSNEIGVIQPITQLVEIARQ